MEFECVEATDLILIHSNKLDYETLENKQWAMLTAVNGANAPSITSSWLQKETQYLVLHLDAKLVKGLTYRLFMKFVGELADDLGGFYRSEYIENGVTKYVFWVSDNRPSNITSAKIESRKSQN